VACLKSLLKVSNKTEQFGPFTTKKYTQDTTGLRLKAALARHGGKRGQWAENYFYA